jgi:predicted NACHT family NTPase
VLDCAVGSIRAVAFSPNGRYLAVGGRAHTVEIWDTHTAQRLTTLQGHSEWVFGLVFLSDQVLVTGSSDQSIQLWDILNEQLRMVLPGHTHEIPALALNREKSVLVSGSNDHTVRLWDISTGQPRTVLYGHTNRVQTVTFSPNGHVIVSGSYDQSVRLWDTSTGQCINVLQGYVQHIEALAFSPDGQRIASAERANIVSLWDRMTGQCCLRFQLTTSEFIKSVIFVPYTETTPEDQMIVTGSDDIIRLWDAQTGRLSETLYGHTDRVTSIAASSDGKVLVRALPKIIVGASTDKGILGYRLKQFRRKTRNFVSKNI